MEYFLLGVVMCILLINIWQELEIRELKKHVEKLESRSYSETSTEEAA